MISIRSLPVEIAAHVGPNLSVERPFQGMAFDTTVVQSERGKFILKRATEPRLGAALVGEQRVLNALTAYRPLVPEAIAFGLHDGVAMSLLSYIPGKNLVEAIEREDVAGRHALMAAYGWTLKRIHTWQCNLLQPADWLTKALDRAARHVDAGVIPSPLRHSGQLDGADPRALLAELRNWRKGVTNELVFSHGDYCMPNVLFADGSVSGVVDWPEGGYADRRYDLATAAWSIGYNLQHPEYVETFLDAYGYDRPVETLRMFEALYVLM